jgi:hypothetical protein
MARLDTVTAGVAPEWAPRACQAGHDRAATRSPPRIGFSICCGIELSTTIAPQRGPRFAERRS